MRAITAGLLVTSPVVLFLLLFRNGADGYPAGSLKPRSAVTDAAAPDDYTKHVTYTQSEKTLVYGNSERLRKGRAPLLADAVEHAGRRLARGAAAGSRIRMAKWVKGAGP